MLKISLIKLIGELKELSTLKVDSFDLLLTSDWSPILTRDSLCLPSGKRFDHQGTNSILRIKYQSKITIYLLHRTKSHNKSISWRHFTPLYPAGGGHCLGHCDCRPPLSLALFREGSKVLKRLCCSMFMYTYSSSLWRLIKRFNFKLPNHAPPLEVPSLREPFMPQTPRPRPVPPFPRTTSPQSPPSEVAPIQNSPIPFLSSLHLQHLWDHRWRILPGLCILQHVTTRK